MPNPHSATVRPARWPEDAKALTAVRTAVFVEEQQVPAALELDGRDPHCRHALAYVHDRPVGAGRVDASGHIGRVAVLAAFRGRGIGRGLMRCLMDQAPTPQVDLNAQTHATPFYEGLGFVAEGAEFMEAGIAHIRMVCHLRET